MMGGEPLITDEFLYFLQQVDKHDLYENIYLILTTNLSVLSYKQINYLEYFDKFSKIAHRIETTKPQKWPERINEKKLGNTTWTHSK